jgi:hypothetical protein
MRRKRYQFQIRFNRIGIPGITWLELPMRKILIHNPEYIKAFYLLYRIKILPKCRKQYKHRILMKK